MSKRLIKVLGKVRSTGSTTEKVDLLKLYKSSLMKKIFFMTYDPFTTFGISKVCMEDVHFGKGIGDKVWFKKVWKLLAKLKARKLTGGDARLAVVNLMQEVQEPWATLLYQILNGDLRLGAKNKLINKVYPEQSTGQTKMNSYSLYT